MHALVQEKLRQVIALCERHHVARLYLFGSGAGERFNPVSSDLDFLVEYLPDAPAGFGGDFFPVLLREVQALLDEIPSP